MKRTLRATKGLAICLLGLLFATAWGWPRRPALLWAQSAIDNPLLAPVAPPAGPSPLPAPVTTAIAPALAPMPTVAQATPTPALRVFNCTCSGHGNGTNWMGRLTAPSYFQARQSAVGACVAYNERREPMPSLQTTRNSGATTVPILPGSDVPGTATQVAASLPGALNFSPGRQLQMCSNCVCD